jgi:adenylylsulfate kinase
MATPATAQIANRPETDTALAPGATVWLTGLPSAGKTTVAHATAARLRARGLRVEVVDGDAVRESLSAGLGFSRSDRETNISRIGFVAELLARNGVLVLAAVISPYESSRAEVRNRHTANGVPYLEVHVAAPVQVCSSRDVKGLYAKQRTGEIRGLTGVDDVYEAPATPDLVLRTDALTVDESVDHVVALLAERGLV